MKSISQRTIVLSLICLAVLAALGIATVKWTHRSTPNPAPTSQTAPTSNNSGSSQSTTGTGATDAQNKITVNGQPVPPASQERARQSGQYCPSWDAKPGEAAPQYCVRTDQAQ